jgi:hypothetical protein
MHNHSFVSLPEKLCRCFLLLGLASMATSAAAQDNTLSGTYTFVFGHVDQYSVQSNMFGQQVGFCGNGQIPFQYSCDSLLGQDVLTGTLVADGKGSIIAGSSYVLTDDPNRYECSPKNNPTPDCPYKVPSGNPWSNTVSYVVGDEVDSTVRGRLLTFQAVKDNIDVIPGPLNICTSKLPPPKCYWDQLLVSATDKNSSGKGSLTGTYSVQSNGSAVLQLTLSGQKTISFAMVVPTAPLAIGQEVSLVGLPTLTNEINGTGSAVRVK